MAQINISKYWSNISAFICLKELSCQQMSLNIKHVIDASPCKCLQTWTAEAFRDRFSTVNYVYFIFYCGSACTRVSAQACMCTPACSLPYDARWEDPGSYFLTELPGDVAGVSKAGHESRGARFEMWSLFSRENGEWRTRPCMTCLKYGGLPEIWGCGATNTACWISFCSSSIYLSFSF